MDNERRFNIIMAIFFLCAMLGVMAFMMWKNQNAEKENIANPSPTVEITVEPLE